MRKPASLLTADRHRQGFTLIELSLTMILSSLLVGLSVTLLWRAHQALEISLQGMQKMETLERMHRLLGSDAAVAIQVHGDGPSVVFLRRDGSSVRHRVDQGLWIREERASEEAPVGRTETPIPGLRAVRWRLPSPDQGREIGVDLETGGPGEAVFEAPIQWVFHLTNWDPGAAQGPPDPHAAPQRAEESSRQGAEP